MQLQYCHMASVGPFVNGDSIARQQDVKGSTAFVANSHSWALHKAPVTLGATGSQQFEVVVPGG